MTSSASPATSHPHAALRTAVRGRVWLPGDADFDEARLPWNRAVDQPAAAVVEAANADDVAALIRYAGDHGATVATQPNGHGATGRTQDAIVLRTGPLDSITIDPAARRAVIGAGVRSGALQAAAAEHGLTALPGSSPVVSVTGVVLGGGLSWFGRAFGWVADSVTAFDVVDAQGRPQHVTAGSDPELFWALRGGGGDYAVVTAVELTLHDAPEVFGGRVLWAGEHTAAVVAAYRSLTADAPDELTAWLSLAQFPGSDAVVAIDVTYLGDETRARALLAGLDDLPAPVADSRRTMTVAELGNITAEPTDPAAGLSRTELLTALDDDAVATLLAKPVAPLVAVQVRHLGGALGRRSDSPHGRLTEPYAVYLFGLPLGPDVTAAVTARQAELAAALPTSGRKPVTFLAPHETLADALDEASIARLRALKADRDPRGVLRSNFPVR
ncbi:oxidoreductase [Luteimicrobium album]|uniref:Oxidoreductase n=1 Tax=Luteimicrobium album TaxID=1054550 RepID=A0ABQ6I5S8_9MICO|nr:FAD-dependent oxidoreductase [Luteimicrobium album]GMA26031.1 oxidoreductase [Luteimicrobium album]